jgi:hypothetical protein
MRIAQIKREAYVSAEGYKKDLVMIKVQGESPMDAPPALYSNFLGIARVATDVQFEFVFLDLNQVAQIIQGGQGSEAAAPVTGQTVAKIIMPAAAFVQLKEHLTKVMADIEKDLTQLEENKNARTNDRRATSS